MARAVQHEMDHLDGILFTSKLRLTTLKKNWQKWKDDWMTRIVFMGTPDFSVPVLRTLIEDGYEVVGVVTRPDRPKGRKKS